jgi:hypothetical protein
MRQAIVPAALVAIAMMLSSCGEVPTQRWNYGRPTSFAFTQAGLIPISERTSNAFASRSITKSEYVDYGGVVDVRLDPADVQSEREASGTFVAAYTPYVFRIPMVKVGFLSSEQSDGFWVILANEGVTGRKEYIDFMEPVYIRNHTRWDYIHYDVMFSGFQLGISDTGGVSYSAQIEVEAPGYSDADMEDYWLTVTKADGTTEIKGYHRKYLGSNRFAVTAGELFGTADAYQYSSPFPVEPRLLLFRESITRPALYFAYEDGTLDAEALREALYGGNEWEREQAFGPGWRPAWTDIPFNGLYVGEDTRRIWITVSWDLENIIELWDYGPDGLHFQIAADYIERFSVVVEQFATGN